MVLNLYDDKVGILDIKAVLNDNVMCDIEMQIINQKDIEKRLLFYWSKMYISNLHNGENYNKLRKCIVILLAGFENYKQMQKSHTKWQILEKSSHMILTEDLEIHIIEIPKIAEKMEEGSLRKWILFLENPEGEETKKMAEKEKEIKEAIETLEDISSDEAKQRSRVLRRKNSY